MTIGDLLKVRVHAISFETETVRVFEFRDLDGNELPAFDAGSHIDVHVSETVCRSYSLINESDGWRYRIAVARDDAGRGGSKLMHSQVAVGQSISISRPRNNFPLVEDAGPSILIAGGIGVTPLLAMLNRLETVGKPWELHYGSRTPEATAFSEVLRREFRHGRVQICYSEPNNNFIDIKGLVQAAPPGAHFYCCGPKAQLDAFLEAVQDLPSEQVHFERFGGDVDHAGGGFDVILARSGKALRVGEGQSILDRLLEEGIDIPNSCREGVCGACETRLIAGEGDHRDLIQTDREKAGNRTIFPCCSGSLGPSLTLDL